MRVSYVKFQQHCIGAAAYAVRMANVRCTSSYVKSGRSRLLSVITCRTLAIQATSAGSNHLNSIVMATAYIVTVAKRLINFTLHFSYARLQATSLAASETAH